MIWAHLHQVDVVLHDSMESLAGDYSNFFFLLRIKTPLRRSQTLQGFLVGQRCDP